MDVTSLNANIPQDEGITIACKAQHNTATVLPFRPTTLHKYLALYSKKTHGTAIETKMAVAFANLFMARNRNKNA